MFDLTFTVIDREGGTVPLTMPIDQAVIAGWTGRDPVARDKHIAELEALGIARPATTPIYYRCSARRLTQEDRIEVCGDQSSGEVEFVLFGWQGRTFVGLGSETLYTNGPAGGGGAWKSARDVVAVASVLLPRELARPQVRFVEA